MPAAAGNLTTLHRHSLFAIADCRPGDPASLGTTVAVAAGNDHMRPPSTSRVSRRPVVLLVSQARDDALEMYAQFLRYHRLSVLAVSTAAEARALARQADIIVTGVVLDGSTDGIELVGRLRDDHGTRHTPIIVLTACAWAEDRERAAHAGCDVFLPEPCLPDDLLHEVRRLLRSTPRHRRREHPDASTPHAQIAGH
jgi:DNA-binding response OmpR family regulator